MDYADRIFWLVSRLNRRLHEHSIFIIGQDNKGYFVSIPKRSNRRNRINTERIRFSRKDVYNFKLIQKSLYLSYSNIIRDIEDKRIVAEENRIYSNILIKKSIAETQFINSLSENELRVFNNYGW